MTLQATFDFDARGVLTKDDDISIVSDPIQSGQNDFPDMSVDISDGTGAAQANQWYRAALTINAGATQSLDLAGGVSSPFGATVTFTAVKALVVALGSPDGSKKVRVGPQGVANAWQGPFSGGAGATVYVDVFYWQPFINYSAGGWAVTAGTGDLLAIHNPGASAVTVYVWVLGIV